MATISNISSKYKDIISKSTFLRLGPPAVYQLKQNVSVETFGALTRKTVGEKNLTKVNKTILLVGETGSGKSTLMNALLNYTMGVEFEDNIWFQIVVDENKSQSKSQTSDVIVYEIFGFEDLTLPYSLTIIDTPGFGDTRGIKHDEKVIRQLFKLFQSKKGINEISAVGLVMKASENRLNDRMKYIFDSVVSLFGKDLEKNIVALITHSDGMPPKNALQAILDAKIKCAKNEKGHPLHFLFNNCQRELRNNKTKRPIINAWELTIEEMGKMSEFLKNAEPQTLQQTAKVIGSRIRLQASIHNLQERIKMAEESQKEILETQEQLEKHKQDLDNDKNFTVEAPEVYKDLEGYKSGLSWLVNDGVTRCTVCEQNCHYPGCTIAKNPSWCQVMSDGRCTVCSGRCSVSSHVKDRKMYVPKSRMVMKTMQDIKNRFESNVNNTTDLLEHLQTAKEKLDVEIEKWVEQAYDHVLQLQQVALTVKTESTQTYLGLLIEKLTEQGDMEKVERLEKIQSEGDDKTNKQLNELFG